MPKRPDKGDGTRINQDIRAREVRVIGSEGELLGVMPPIKALELAREEGLDLVEISPNAEPPVCKILDYGKYRYEQQKKASEARKKQKTVDIKEILLRPNIDDHDFETKMKAAKRFLEDGDKVKFVLRFRGRELSRMAIGLQVLDKVKATLDGLIKIEQEPRSEGRQTMMVVAPIKNGSRLVGLKLHPLKIAALSFIIGDVVMIAAGLVYTNWLMALSATVAQIGNAGLLLRGSGRKIIDSDWLRRVAPYGERFAFSCFVLQNGLFALSGALMYRPLVMYGQIATGVIAGLGSLLCAVWPQNARIPPYKLGGAIGIVASLCCIYAGVEADNVLVIVAAFCGLNGTVFTVFSHRAPLV